jgi:acetyl esterase
MFKSIFSVVLAIAGMNFVITTAPAETLTGVEYAPGLAFDGVIPRGDGPFPAAIIVHGGGWVRGDRRVDVAPLFQPLEDAGFAWFSISYRFATTALDFGTASSDVLDALRFIKSHAAEYRIDPGRIALIGESAGGQLAAMAALDPHAGVKAVVAMYTPSDLPALISNSAGLIPDSIRNSLKGTPFEGLVLARLAQLSPIESVRAGMPPFLFIHGTADRLVPFDQSTAMCARMKTVGASCEVFQVDGAGHGMRWWESHPAMARPWKREMIRWLREQLTTARV